ncbi:MAG: hypothetical protein FWE10_05810 [Rikenellaceae bacterium]|nr:hypothetical protein [Rikenellaceae bacterium]MCL2692992.1 hypothetical protein [Rikenellaceae bacterium]
MIKTFDVWIQRLDITYDVLQSVGMQYHRAKKVPQEEFVFLDLLKKIKANLGTVKDIIVELEKIDPVTGNFEKKIPLSILLRSCIADCMIGLYLGTFKNPEFSEELDVLNLDFVKYMESMIPLEVELWNMLSGESNDSQIQLDERYDGFKKWLRSNKGEPWQIKKPADFRSDASRTAKIDFPSIHERLRCKSKAFAYMYNYYRYYSQYEHYTSIGRHVFDSPFEEEIPLMERALVSIMHSVLLIASLLPKITEEVSPLIDALNRIIPQEDLS